MDISSHSNMDSDMVRMAFSSIVGINSNNLNEEMKKKHTAVVDTINFGIFDNYALCCIGTNVKEVITKQTSKEWKDYLSYLDSEELTSNNFVNKVTMPNSKTYWSIFLDKKDDEYWYVVVAHEVLHLCQFIAKHYHLDMVQEKESIAYLHSHLMKQILKLNETN